MMDTQDLMIHCIKDEGRIYECDMQRQEIKELRQQVAELRSCIERCVATTMTAYNHHQVMSDPSHFVNQALTRTAKKEN